MPEINVLVKLITLFNFFLNPQEYILFVHVIEQHPHQHDPQKGVDNRFNAAQHDSPSEKLAAYLSDIDKTVQEIDENGIQTDNTEKERPFFPTFDINDPVKNAH